MLSYPQQLDLEIMFGELFEKCKDGKDLDVMIDLLISIIENIGEEVREEQGWE